MMYKRLVGLGSALALAMFLFATGGAPAWADDVTIVADVDCFGPDCMEQAIHVDADPFKGWANFELTNLGSWAWLDFHLILFDCGDGSVDNVDWIVDSPYEPWSTQAGLTWEVDNDAAEPTLDFAFTEPVEPDETAWFHIYTDNTYDMLPSFGVKFYLTIIPEPSTALLLGSGLIGLAVHGRRRRV